jgi:pilus assembly protein FimV
MPLAAAIALSLPAAPVHALSLGEIEVSSSLGQPLRARVPVSLRAGEELSADCISVVRTDPFGGDAAGLLASARVELRKLAGKSLLLVSSSQPVEEPVARLLLRVSCSDGGSIYREYTLLLDPPQYQMARAEPLGARGQPLRLPQAPPPPNQYTQQIFSGINEYTVKEGDTLDSIVKNRYPGSPRLQRRLRQAIATANSDVLPSVTSPLPEAGTPLLIPELPPLPIAQAKPRIKPKRLVQRPPEPIAPEAAAPPPPTARARQAAPAASVASGRQPEFVLRLSRSALDTNRPITEDERASLRERQRLLDADDLTASMLLLQHEMRQMKAEIETLKTQLRQQQGGTGAPGVSAAQAPAAQPAEPPRQSGAAAPKWYEQWTPLAQRWWWVLPALALGALLLAMVRRRRSATYADAFENAMPATTTFTQAPTLAPTQAPLTTATRAAAQQVEAGHAKRELDVQARYLADRFPELADAGVDLADTEAVVEQSRVYFMEDGAADKAIELLEYTTSKYPEQPKPWLALLEIYRQMKMKGAFEKQAIVFRDRFRDVAQWKKVCAIGRTIDPNNALYAQPADEVPAEAAAVEDAPLARLEAEQVRTQNWLDIPLDFTPALRGENLRSELLSELPEDRPEPKVPEQMGVQTVDFDLDADAEQVQKERVEPRLVRKPSQ